MTTKATEVQTLILSKERFETKEEANAWVSEHDFKIKEGAPDETEESWRYRQREPSEFVEGSFRTIELTDGVKAVIGTPKEEKMKTKKEREALERGAELLVAVDATMNEVVTLEFPLGKFREAATAKAWAKNHGFPVLGVTSHSGGFVVRCRDDRDFSPLPFRAAPIGKSEVVARIGELGSWLPREEVEKAVPDASASNEEKRDAQKARAKKWGIEALEGKGENLTFPSGGPTNEGDYADPVNLKYPVHTEANAANARVRFKQNADVYEQEKSKAIIHERIVRAELEFGIEPSFDPEDPLDALLPGDLKDRLGKAEKVAFAKRGEIIVVHKQAGGEDVPEDEVRFFGIVMKPEVPDVEGDVTSEVEIENANFGFMRDFQTVGFMHKKDVSEAVKIIQDVVAPVDLEFPLPDGGAKKIAKGTWYQELWSDDPEIVKRVKVDHTLNGLSIGGFARRVPVTEMVGGELRVEVPEGFTSAEKRAIKEAVAKAEGDPALARFVDLRVEEVSLVDAAANEEEFFIIKRRREEMKTKKNEPAAADPKTEQPPKGTEVATQKTEPESTPAPEPTIAEQVAEGVKAGVKAALEEAKATPSSTPTEEATEGDPPPAPQPVEKDSGNDAILAELKKINTRLDGVEAAQKDAGVARAVAKGQSAPEGTETPAEEPEKPVSKWAGTAVHAAFNRTRR